MTKRWAFLSRQGFTVPGNLLNRDFSRAHEYSDGLREIWLEVYRNPEEHFEAYELAEELVDVEDWFQQWRFRHMTTVRRIIGQKRGTGGSSGVAYLKTALERTFFPELWGVRTGALGIAVSTYALQFAQGTPRRYEDTQRACFPTFGPTCGRSVPASDCGAACPHCAQENPSKED